MVGKNEVLQKVIWNIRRLFQQLACESGELLEDLEINSSQRAVLEFLSLQDKQTVPNIARRYNVSRQHIQKVVNELTEKGMVESIRNPEHKRSVLIQRTAVGHAVFEEARRREAQVIEHMAQHFKLKDLESTLTLLIQMEEFMQSEQWQRIKLNVNPRGV